MHPTRKGTAPYWQGAAQLEVGGSCPVEYEDSSHHREWPIHYTTIRYWWMQYKILISFSKVWSGYLILPIQRLHYKSNCNTAKTTIWKREHAVTLLIRSELATVYITIFILMKWNLAKNTVTTNKLWEYYWFYKHLIHSHPDSLAFSILAQIWDTVLDDLAAAGI